MGLTNSEIRKILNSGSLCEEIKMQSNSGVDSDSSLMLSTLPFGVHT